MLNYVVDWCQSHKVGLNVLRSEHAWPATSALSVENGEWNFGTEGPGLKSADFCYL